MGKRSITDRYWWLEKILQSEKITNLGWQSYLTAFLLPAVAAGTRLFFLKSLAMSVPFVTFYPAVMISALYGGLRAGLFATLVSTFFSAYWMGTPDNRFVLGRADWVGIAVFVFSCSMISFVCEAMIAAKTRLKEQTLELTKARDEAQVANNAKSVFLANISHELRTPLNAILGFSRILNNDHTIQEEQKKLIGIINRSGEHLLNLINDTLDMAKIEAGRVKVEAVSFNLVEMVEEITDLMNDRAKSKHLQLQISVTPEVPHIVKCDYSKLRQIILNLIGNAIKFTNNGFVSLALSAKDTIQPNSKLLYIGIEDTGIGIGEDDLLNVFKPFFQISEVQNQKGTGLGLAITKQYVQLMNGTISIKSALNVGTKFTIELPVEVVEEKEFTSPIKESKRVVGLLPGQQEYRILIVEDQIENRILLKNQLEEVGFVVQVAENGAEGVEMFKSWHPHFIWMDRRMPVMDGLEATKKIRSLEGGNKVKIAAITASVFLEQRDEVLAAGLDDFVRKPYNPEEVFSCMEKLLSVKYVYSNDNNTRSANSLKSFRPEEIKILPLDIRIKLEETLIRLDVEKVNEQIEKIITSYPNVGLLLKQHSNQLEFTALIKALQSCRGV